MDYTNKTERIQQLTKRLQQINNYQDNHYNEHQRIDTPIAKLELETIKYIAQELGDIPKPQDQQQTQTNTLNIKINNTNTNQL